MLMRDGKFLTSLCLMAVGLAVLGVATWEETRGSADNWMLAAAGALACVLGVRAALARRRELKSGQNHT